jgi:hypothetical protein
MLNQDVYSTVRNKVKEKLEDRTTLSLDLLVSIYDIYKIIKN